MVRKISEERKAAYYVGIGLIVAGLLLFCSTFVTAIRHFGDFDDFEGRGKSMMVRAFGGMGVMVVGGIVAGIGARGVAGSGLKLDPEQARDELEPYSRMAGGMIKDALDEADISLGPAEPEKVVMIKCPACGRLNEEDSKFCQECGGKL